MCEVAFPERRNVARTRFWRIGWRWIACGVLPPAAIVILALGVVSAFGQLRVFTPYGPSFAFDQGVLVVELEHPRRLGFRFVGSSREEQHRYANGRFVVAWNKAPEYDSELRKSTTRHWLPRLGTFKFGGRSSASWVSIPGWMLFLAALIPSIHAWRAVLQRRRIGLCHACGYSLDGLPLGSPCPECGNASPTGAKAVA